MLKNSHSTHGLLSKTAKLRLIAALPIAGGV